MIPGISRYVNAATSFVPNYGKAKACIFIASLIAETSTRFLGPVTKPKIDAISYFKSFQIVSCLQSNPAFSSYRISIPTVLIVPFLFSSYVASKVASLSEVYWEGKKIPVTTLSADRPPVISFFVCAKEIANIASKVIQSLAVGLALQKAFTGQTEGKIRTVVSAVLLALSALNIYYKRGEKPHAL